MRRSSSVSVAVLSYAAFITLAGCGKAVAALPAACNKYTDTATQQTCATNWNAADTSCNASKAAFDAKNKDPKKKYNVSKCIASRFTKAMKKK